MNKSIVLALSFSLVVAFTFSCSSNNDDGSGESSSSEETPSSSSVTPSSSSAEVSSSSSSAESSNLCDDFVEDEERLHHEKLKKQFCDKRDGKRYVYALMPDGKNWMAENLNYETQGSLCMDNNPYGRLYDWITARIICPEGWRLPSDYEWDMLEYSSDCASSSLRAKLGGWPIHGTPGGTDNYGFSALPGGYISDSGSHVDINNAGYWWSGGYILGEVLYRRMDNSTQFCNIYSYNSEKTYLRSVRCVRDIL